ncbi:ATP-binding protein, partial [bacterium]|nr:ATP-binding protein [bacterium]
MGKSTLLKQWMLTLLHEGVNPQHIAFLTGELIDDHHVVVRLVQDILSHKSSDAPFYLILDEVTYIREWDKAVKFLADAGFMEGVILIVTGSDLILIREARTRFPGRRGKADKVNFHLRPLSYSETLRLKKTLTNTQIEEIIISGTNPSEEILRILYEEFKNFLIHGGYLTAINDMAMEKRILPATFSIYSDWIRGHMVKRGKKEHFLHEILSAIIKQYGSQTTWHSLSSQLSIDHHRTIADYVETLVSMDAVFIQQAILENKLTAAPKKARKVIFTDPFIFHAVRSWLQQVQCPFKDQVLFAVNDPHLAGKLVEGVVTANYSRKYPTFYIKAEGEVDIAYIYDKRFFPVEVKWT